MLVVEDVQGRVHVFECGACLGEVSLGHAEGEVMGVVLIEIEYLIEGFEVDHVLLVDLGREGRR